MADTRPSMLAPDIRPLAYRWLSGLLADAPAESTLEGFTEPTGRTLLNAMADDPALLPLVDAIRAISADTAERRRHALDLAVSHGRLFLGAAGPASPQPYESAHISERGTLFQEPTGAMANLLRDLDLSVDIAMKLGVMAELAARFAHAGAQENGPEERALRRHQIDFVDGHLLNWLPDFRSDCAAIEPTSFYATALSTVVAFLERDRAWLAAADPE